MAPLTLPLLDRKNPRRQHPDQDDRHLTDNPIRAVFVSDLHLGSRHCNAGAFLHFLSQVQPEFLYLVGDFIDGWELRRRWRWEPSYNRILQRVFSMARRGTKVRYTPGNHDSFLRDFLHDFGDVEIADQFIHRTRDHKRFVVIHGDQFDKVELCAQWLSAVGSVAYDLLLWSNRMVNIARKNVGMGRCSFSGTVKRRIKQAIQYVGRYQEVVAQHARRHACHGIICGHIHTPTIATYDGVMYCNTGDWVESCSALLEHADGTMRIVQFEPDPEESHTLETARQIYFEPALA